MFEKKVAFCTLGCKTNQYETDAMTELFAEKGYTITDFSESSDIYIVNTCTVTNIADRKSRQMLHRAKKMNPEAVVVAVGCYVQAAGEKLLADEKIDLIIGNNQKKAIVDIVESYKADKAQIKDAAILDLDKNLHYETLSISKVAEHTRAYIKIQDGCNQFCTYCIIPYARGRVRSRSEEDILNEVKQLADKGYQEIVLTGIHISSYGRDFIGENYNENPERYEELLHLIQELAKVEGIKRIRLGSLEPRIITDAFAAGLKATGKVCGHFHLSLQSGCIDTLKRMNRHYTPEMYLERCEVLRRHFEHPAITTDVIVGFPGETEEEFAQTEKYLAQVGFAQMHIFKYSRRDGTIAANMKEQVDEQIKHRRSEALFALEAKMGKDYMSCWMGKEQTVLYEETTEIQGEIYMTGYTDAYIRVAVKDPAGRSNEMVKVRMTDKKSEDFVICERID